MKVKNARAAELSDFEVLRILREMNQRQQQGAAEDKLTDVTSEHESLTGVAMESLPSNLPISSWKIIKEGTSSMTIPVHSKLKRPILLDLVCMILFQNFLLLFWLLFSSFSALPSCSSRALLVSHRQLPEVFLFLVFSNVRIIQPRGMLCWMPFEPKISYVLWMALFQTRDKLIKSTSLGKMQFIGNFLDL